jgi:hypothetical protein
MDAHRLVLTVFVFGIIIITLFFGKPSITGFVPTETYVQELNIDVYESQRFVLSYSNGEPLKLSSLMLSGNVYGNGLVNAYLSNGVDRLLAFSNKRKKGSSMEQITGLAVSELNIAPGEKLNQIEALPDGYLTKSGLFQNECLETCILNEDMMNRQVLYLDVIIEPGTSVHISEVKFSTMSE